jgi:hypothetical protein
MGGVGGWVFATVWFTGLLGGARGGAECAEELMKGERGDISGGGTVGLDGITDAIIRESIAIHGEFGPGPL